MVTILDALRNAEYNLNNAKKHQTPAAEMMVDLGINQLHNVIGLLEKGYDPYDDIDELIGEGTVEDVPEKGESDEV